MTQMPGNFWPPRAMDLNENGEWVEVPLEKIMPKWMAYNFTTEDEEMDVAIVRPFMENEFKKWLMATRGIKEKSAEDYLMV